MVKTLNFLCEIMRLNYNRLWHKKEKIKVKRELLRLIP